MALKLRTSLPDSECVERLNIALAPEFVATGSKHIKPLVGQVYGHQFTARKRRRYTHNMFEPIFFGRISTNDNTTLIIGGFRMHPLTIAIVVLGTLPFFYEAVKTWSFIPISTLPIMYGLVFIIYLVSSSNKDYIRVHLLDILDAEEVRSNSGDDHSAS